MAQDSVKFSIPLLNGDNYVSWKTKVKAILTRDDLWDVVREPKPAQVDDVWVKRNNKALACITLSVEDSQLTYFAHLDGAYEVWQVLSKKYERSTFGSRLYLRRKLYGIQYRGGSMSDHINAIMEVVSLLRGSEKSLEEEEIVAVLLVSLPESYSGLVTALEGRDEADLTIEYVTGKMLDEYQRRVESGESSNKNSEVALQTATANPKSSNRTISDTSEKGKRIAKKVNKETRTCFFCSKQGHIKADCRSFRKTQQNKCSSSEPEKMTTTAKVGVQSNHVTFSAKEEARAASTGV